MQNCYAEDAVFSDCVFQNLNSSQVKSMWEMFCKNGKDLRIEFRNILADDKTGSAEWIAHYTFSATGRKVVNRIKANFRFDHGKFSEHSDEFNFYNWARQSLGTPGLLLGWSSYLRNKVRRKAMNSLAAFMVRH